ncbi:MAG: YceH family protein [Thermoanaerobaculia bacterium]
MTFVPTLDTEGPHRPRVPRTLDPVEIRVLGSLIEKQLSTPEYYPLTLNALVAACNQKSNREPVMDLEESEIQRALARLQDERLVWRVMGGRAVRFDHNLDTVWHLRKGEKAILGVLFLRGPQTAGELRGRCERLHPFESIAEIDELLREMGAHSEPLVTQLPRRPGQKEERWAHSAGGAIIDTAPLEPETAAPSGVPLSVRVLQLEDQVARLTTELAELKSKLGE